ncbi:MAG: hypothetical protein WBX25_02490 [Rhodomicrobium sp.]
MDKSYDVIRIRSGAGGSIPFQPQVHRYARGAVKLIGAAAKAAGTEPWVMV